jgi:hypothetical protein
MVARLVHFNYPPSYTGGIVATGRDAQRQVVRNQTKKQPIGLPALLGLETYIVKL